MSRLQLRSETSVLPQVPDDARVRYFVVREEDVWFIKFDGEKFGPYKTEREAMLFAVDAAQKLGEQGKDTQVLQMGESEHPTSLWTYGTDSYPPGL